MKPAQVRPVKVELSAVIVALQADESQARPMVLTPAGPQGREIGRASCRERV